MIEQSNDSQRSDALSSHWVPLPEAAVEMLVRNIYGLTGTVKRLSSERDETFRFAALDGRNYTLKIANPAEDPEALTFQSNALLHLAAVASEVPVPRMVSPLTGGSNSSFTDESGERRIVRLLTFLEGEQQYRTLASLQQNWNLGCALAALGHGLRSFEERPNGKLLWDISHALDLSDLVGCVGHSRQLLVKNVLAEFARKVPPVAEQLRTQIIHNDFNPHNILVHPDRSAEIVGIIDFGDMVHAPLINDLAVALSYHVATDDWPALSRALVCGYHSVAPLTPLEVDVLPILVKARLAMTIIITEWRAASRPDNRDYILRNHPSALEGLQRLSKLTDPELRRILSPSCEA
ncbi:phosphotransferase [Rhizobium leguminosarum]|uniref:phosphotransferase n=1 Tax=Rhizobium leguminosarum TaxID=384 RepID=UPI001C967559|nr:phosphotransferase [Rhizobium leguminosarum]MBY5361822.1 phosphotransferase [Rhizobium leguminosarum]MBY5664851.1 phosphotransferase [Rhizobium leguminosarum]MBY5677665.1 phosphotransferase [Rhizobium leguminosarum]MBY5720862.1 phosphotransferase [Rhizobium leguminosarum]